MVREKRFLVDVGIRDLPFPMKVISKAEPEGQNTIAGITINARIMKEFEANWIDTFIKIVHQHKGKIGTETLRHNIMDYLHELKATMVKIDFDYPFFVEKETPVSKEKGLVKYNCRYTAKASSVEEKAKIIFKTEVPVITTYPASVPEEEGGLFGQLSIVDIEAEPKKNIYPEDMVALADRHALAPIYSFLSKEDQIHIIKKIHSELKDSVVMTDEIKSELSEDSNIEWYLVRTSNFGMLHTYSTFIGTEKSMWVPFSGYNEEL
jgi:GTP cyclohydrolase IB